MIRLETSVLVPALVEDLPEPARAANALRDTLADDDDRPGSSFEGMSPHA